MSELVITPYRENLVANNVSELSRILSRWFENGTEIAKKVDSSINYSTERLIRRWGMIEFYLGQSGNILTVGRHAQCSRTYHRIARIQMNF